MWLGIRWMWFCCAVLCCGCVNGARAGLEEEGVGTAGGFGQEAGEAAALREQPWTACACMHSLCLAGGTLALSQQMGVQASVLGRCRLPRPCV